MLKILEHLSSILPVMPRNKILAFRDGIHKMLARIANSKGPDQTASDLGLCCLSRPFWQANNAQNFRTFTV